MISDVRDPLRLPGRAFVPIVGLGLAQALTLAGLIVLIWRIVDALIAGPAEPWGIFGMIGLLALLMLANAGLRAAEFILAENLGYEIVRGLRMVMYGHMRSMAPRQIQHRSRGSLLLRFTGDLSMFRTWISRGVARGLISAMVLLTGAVVLFLLNPWISLTVVGVLSAGAALTLRIGKRLKRMTAQVRRRRALLTSNVDEQINALAVIQVFGRTGGEYDRLSKQNDAMTRTLFREARIRGMLRGLAAGVGWLAVAGVLAVGTLEVMQGRASVGMIVAAVVAIRQLTGPVRTLGYAHEYWRRADISRRKMRDFLRSRSRPYAAPGMERLRVRRGRIELRNVSVEGAVREIDATVEPRQIVAIVGPVGSGKSTLLGLIARLVEPTEGQVVIDEQDVSERTLRSSFRQISMVGPDLPLMRGTLLRNLKYRNPRASEHEVWRVIMATRLDEILAELKGGLNAWITEGGANLSAGQRQRIALARAILGNPRILLLDEPTTNLDAEGKEIFRQVITRHHGTTLLVTHDPEEAALADQVWLMREGRLVETISGDEYRDRQWKYDPVSATYSSHLGSYG
jgi:ABC-type multidrug transport system fused ATPase/permease subunit